MNSFEDRDGFIWFNGKLVPWRDAKLHVLSHGLHYGNCVFEGERTYDGEVFRLTEHSQRLLNSAKFIDMVVPFTIEDLDAATRQVIEANGIRDGYIRPVAWRGSEAMSISAPNTRVHVSIAAWSWPHVFTAGARRRGIRVNISSWVRPSPTMVPVQAKAAGLYMLSAMSRRAAEVAGFDDALVIDHQGYLAEATGANMFLVLDGKLLTPVPESCLNGITRQTVIALARAEGVEVFETRITCDHLHQAEEVFLTGTAYEIQPVSEVDGINFDVGPLSLHLADRFERLVRCA